MTTQTQLTKWQALRFDATGDLHIRELDDGWYWSTLDMKFAGPFKNIAEATNHWQATQRR